MSDTGRLRPVGVNIMFALAALVGILGFPLGLVTFVAFGLYGGLWSIAVAGFVCLVPGIIALLFAYGVWKMKKWAWWLGVIGHGLMAAYFVYSTIRIGIGAAFASGILYALTAVYLATILVYLFIPQVRRAFDVDNQSRRSRVRRFWRNGDYEEASHTPDAQ